MDDSFLARIDPKWKTLFAFVISLAVALLDDVRFGVAVLAYGFLLAFLGRLPPRKTARRIGAIHGLMVSLWLTLPFTMGGEMFFVGTLPLSLDGLELALLLTLKATAMILVVTALMGTSALHHVLLSLGELGVPSKLVVLLHFCSRYVFVIGDENRRIREAASLRGFHPTISWRGFWATGSLVGCLLVKSYDRSLRVQDALVLRGFDGSFPMVGERQGTSRPDMARFLFLTLLFGGCAVLCSVWS